jgi:aspartyl-tRNA(Asn)/glutamyl-tRNA(Gln) amidotransferase subunit A
VSGVRAIAEDVRNGRRTAVEVLEEHLAVIDERESAIHAFNLVTREAAFAAAQAVDADVAAGRDPGPLAGVPVAYKDNLCTRGVPTTCSSRILEGWKPPYDATVVQRMSAAGAVMLGKTNLDEFAMGSSTEHSAFGPTRNPHDVERVPGGSSGGSAAAVAAGFAPLALGSDTGGSIRQPAALCGVVGVKPTYGMVSRYGLVAFASSFDQIGPFTRDVADAATAMEVLAGHDPADSTSIPEGAPELTSVLDRGVAGLRIGLIREMLVGIDEDVIARVQAAADALRDEGRGGHCRRDERGQPSPGVRRGGHGPGDARHVRPQRRLLRRLLRQGPAGAYSHSTRFRRGVRRPRPAVVADVSVGGVPFR